MNKIKVLFLCTGNSARSQMAEAFLRRLGGDRFEVYSAGITPEKGINPLTLRVMQEIGYDMAGHTAKDITQYLGRVHFAYLITVCSRAEENCPIFPGMGQRLNWSMDDPAAVEGSEEQRLAKFRQVRDALKKRIEEWLVEIKADMSEA